MKEYSNIGQSSHEAVNQLPFALSLGLRAGNTVVTSILPHRLSWHPLALLHSLN